MKDIDSLIQRLDAAEDSKHGFTSAERIAIEKELAEFVVWAREKSGWLRARSTERRFWRALERQLSLRDLAELYRGLLEKQLTIQECVRHYIGKMRSQSETLKEGSAFGDPPDPASSTGFSE